MGDPAKRATLRANAMPAPTWHRLNTNYADIEAPEGLACGANGASVELSGAAAASSADAFDAALAAMEPRYAGRRRKSAPGDAAHAQNAADELDVPALSAMQAASIDAEENLTIAEAFETGMGADAASYLRENAACGASIEVPAGACGSAAVRIEAAGGEASCAAVDVVVREGATLDLLVTLDSPAAAADASGVTGLAGCELRVACERGASANIVNVHTLDSNFVSLDDTGIVLDEGAKAHVSHRVLGAGRAYLGFAADLRGDASDLNVTTHYVGHGAQERDFNYIVRHRGKSTTSFLDANGVLMDESSKVLRGTIDLVHGCKGAEGTERETVLLADEHVTNKTVPVILCDEDDVAGNHGATIGHMRPEQLTYLMSRGISPHEAERLFAVAAFEETALLIHDEAVHEGIMRVARELGMAEGLAALMDDATAQDGE